MRAGWRSVPAENRIGGGAPIFGLMNPSYEVGSFVIPAVLKRESTPRASWMPAGRLRA